MTVVPSTVGDWLAALTPLPPPALATRLRELMQPYMNCPGSEVPDVLLEAGERALEELLSENATSRESALDLLAIDALVTYAFEACSDFPEELEAKTRSALTRISNVPTRIGDPL